MSKEDFENTPASSVNKKLIIIGGGAAGFFCAINAAQRADLSEIIILEKNNKVLSKVRVSGGGRCNLTHACFDINEMAKCYPRGKNFVKKTFHQFFTTDTITWFEKRGVNLKTESDGRMFPVSDTSESIIDCFYKEVNKHGIKIHMNSEVKKIAKQNNSFYIYLSSGKIEIADYICVACGGYAKSSLFQWLIDIGHSISEPVPSLFTFNLPGHSINSLMGISVENVSIKIEASNLSNQGPLLITHWGLSGPAVLKLSAWGARELAEKKYEFRAHINWMPGMVPEELKKIFHQLRTTNATAKVGNHQFNALPKRLWLYILKEAGVPDDLVFVQLSGKIENRIISMLTDFVVEVKGKTTFKEEFVTAGGVQLHEVDSQTMMSRKIENIFFAGEVLDVDGITGGYNFQHAWTSGWIAAKSIGKTNK